MDDYTIVNINGTDFYVPSNLVQYITSNGVSTYSSNIYGYSEINSSLDNYQYPRITFRTYGYPVLSNSYNSSQVLTNATVSFPQHSQYLRFAQRTQGTSMFLLMLICLVVMFRRFK